MVTMAQSRKRVFNSPPSGSTISWFTCCSPITGISAADTAVAKEPVSLLTKVSRENEVPSLRSLVFHSI